MIEIDGTYTVTFIQVRVLYPDGTIRWEWIKEQSN